MHSFSKSVFHGNLINLTLSAIIIAFLFEVQLVNGQSRCSNPNGNRGSCRSIYDCPVLLGMVGKPGLNDNDRRFLLESQCTGGSGKLPHICCTEDTTFTSNSNNNNNNNNGGSIIRSTPGKSNGRGNVLPTPPECGPEPIGEKIYNGNNTAIDEFPWMVLLEYRRSNGEKVANCGGSLINQRYVLTAAHCLTGRILIEIGELESIRLGEYDLTNNGIDCVEGDCAEPIVTIGVEESIPHPDYSDSNLNRYGDIGLVRLNQDVTYSGFIKPVCIPSQVNLRNSAAGTDLIVAGWGRTLTARKAAIKQKLAIPVVDHDFCRQKFASRRVTIINSQLCAGGEFGKDSCDGDSGGPLMRKTPNNYWALEGIVSFGRSCGLEGWPAVYTRVASYENWIKNTLRP